MERKRTGADGESGRRNPSLLGPGEESAISDRILTLRSWTRLMGAEPRIAREVGSTSRILLELLMCAGKTNNAPPPPHTLYVSGWRALR